MSAYPLTLFYEGACAICRLEIHNLNSRNNRGLLRFVDISVPGFDVIPFGVTLGDLLNAIHAITADGTLVKGVQVFGLAYAAVGLGWITAPTGWPFLRPLFDQAYVQFARHRYWLSKRLAVPWRMWLPGRQSVAVGRARTDAAKSEQLFRPS